MHRCRYRFRYRSRYCTDRYRYQCGTGAGTGTGTGSGTGVGTAAPTVATHPAAHDRTMKDGLARSLVACDAKLFRRHEKPRSVGYPYAPRGDTRTQRRPHTTRPLSCASPFCDAVLNIRCIEYATAWCPLVAADGCMGSRRLSGAGSSEGFALAGSIAERVARSA